MQFFTPELERKVMKQNKHQLEKRPQLRDGN